MDKKNTTLGVLCLLGAFGMLLYTSRHTPPPLPPPSVTPPTTNAPAGPEAGKPPAATITAPSSSAASPEAPAGPTATLPSGSTTGTAANSPPPLKLPLEAAHEGELPFTVLENDFIAVHFTKFGGAIAEVVLKKYPATKESDAPYVLNALHAASALSFLDFPGADADTAYTLESQTADTIVWKTTVASKVEVRRTYQLTPVGTKGDPYLIRHTTEFRNLTGEPLNTPNLLVNLGTAAPVNASDVGDTVKVGSYDADGDKKFVGRGNFMPSWISKIFGGSGAELGAIPSVHPTLWAAVKNQFFVSILTPDEPGVGVTAQRVDLGQFSGEPQPRTGMTATVTMAPRQIAAGGSDTIGFNFYAGPKEYDRLSNRDIFKHNEEIVMEFGFFSFFSKLLLKMLKGLHSLFAGVSGAWGLAIIATTLIVRGLLWPLTAAGARSSKRMAKIQGPLKAIQEKYKDNKVKQQEETMKLFREHKINPVAGCLPLFIQLPIFFGLFSMLRGAAELRFAEFLWINDLSSADTIAHIFGFPINPTPLLMGVSMFFQMRMTPVPTTDNPSAKMMKFMPFMVTALCYTQSSGLAVYWTASNLFSIFQQWMTNRKKDDPAAQTVVTKAGAGAGAKPVRDGRATTVVSDRKKKK